MAAACSAGDLHTAHAPAVILFLKDSGPFCRLKEAGPSGTRFEFVVRIKQRLAAARTAVLPFFVVVPVVPRKGALGAFFSEDKTGHMGQGFTPFLFGLVDLGGGIQHRRCFHMRRFILSGAGAEEAGR